MIAEKTSNIGNDKLSFLLDKKVQDISVGRGRRVRIHGGNVSDLDVLDLYCIRMSKVPWWTIVWEEIPDHMKAATWLIVLAISITAFLSTGQIVTAITGGILAGLGEFFVNQTAHLKIHGHQVTTLTWIEQQQHAHPRLFRYVGVSILAMGMWVCFHT